jgi:hypothetical protein
MSSPIFSVVIIILLHLDLHTQEPYLCEVCTVINEDPFLTPEEKKTEPKSAQEMRRQEQQERAEGIVYVLHC